jgi:hypothetical protein
MILLIPLSLRKFQEISSSVSGNRGRANVYISNYFTEAASGQAQHSGKLMRIPKKLSSGYFKAFYFCLGWVQKIRRK